MSNGSQIISWNQGEISAQELVMAFKGILRVRLKVRGLQLSSSIIKDLAISLERAPKRFESIAEFLAYADNVVLRHIEVKMPHVSDYNKVDYFDKIKRVEMAEGLDRAWRDLKRIEMLEVLDRAWTLDNNLDIDASAKSISPRKAVAPIGATEHLSGTDIHSIKNLEMLVTSIGEADPSLARLAVLRFFGELKLTEIAGKLSIPLVDVRKDWERLKAILSASRIQDSPIILLPVESNLLRELRRDPKLLKSLDWRSFELVLSTILERLGFEIELQRGTKDGGIDIFALKCDPALGAHRYLIQAKRWSHRVGIEPVRELLFLQSHHRASKGCLATTATFSRGAWRLAEEYRWQLELRDFNGLQEWLRMAFGNG